MQSKQIQRIKLENLLIDLRNPRYDPRHSQQEALKTIAVDQGIKLVNLAEDILDKGLNPSELPMVTPDEPGKFIILEGNRRVAALKLLSSQSLLKSLEQELPAYLDKRWQALQEQDSDSVPDEIDCVVLSQEDAHHWILIKHTGENEGVGVLGWDGRATHRFRGESPALQAIERVENSPYIDDDTREKLPKIAITNVERILVTPEARQLLGVDVKGSQLIIKSPEEDAVARLSIIVSDVANRHIRVSDLDTKEQRVRYAEEVAAQPLPTPQAPKTSKPPRKKTQISPARRYLVPNHLTLTIPQTRINQIFIELKKLNTEQFTNSCAVLLRVFVEMSVDDFAKRREISLKVTGTNKDKRLREKLKDVASYLEKNGLCDKPELRGIRTLVSNRDHVLSVDSWNAYVHNKDYNPTPKELRNNWDSIQAFIQKLWTV